MHVICSTETAEAIQNGTNNLLNKSFEQTISAATNSVLAVPWNMQTESSLFYLSERAYVMIRYQSAGGSEI